VFGISLMSIARELHTSSGVKAGQSGDGQYVWYQRSCLSYGRGSKSILLSWSKSLSREYSNIDRRTINMPSLLRRRKCKTWTYRAKYMAHHPGAASPGYRTETPTSPVFLSK
jgi:hypothetical protein